RLVEPDAATTNGGAARQLERAMQLESTPVSGSSRRFLDTCTLAVPDVMASDRVWLQDSAGHRDNSLPRAEGARHLMPAGPKRVAALKELVVGHLQHLGV